MTELKKHVKLLRRRYIVVDELLPMLIWYAGALILGAAVAAALGCVTVFVGGAVGVAVSGINFFARGYAGQIALRRGSRAARRIIRLSYVLRYIGTAAALFVPVALGFANIIAVFVPLYVPRLYYSWKYAVLRTPAPAGLNGNTADITDKNLTSGTIRKNERA